MFIEFNINIGDAMRNLDMTTLRSFVAVAELGGVTRAAGVLNLTQSAVSMQLKRLEDLLALDLLDRTSRRIALTATGEQLLGYARRMVDMNDEVMMRLTDQKFEGEIILGVPHDIVYPAIPQVLQRFYGELPRVKVQLSSSYTKSLKEQFARGQCDLILTTETEVEPGGETLTEKPLRWVGAKGGTAWRQRPLRLAFGRFCSFRAGAVEALNRAGIDWEMAVESDSDRSIEAMVSADLAVQTMLEGTEAAHLECIAHGGALPELSAQKVNLYGLDTARSEIVGKMADLLRHSFKHW